MTARPCIGCTLRFVDGQRCEILSAKLAGIKGLGLTSINFKCTKRADNFKPGQPVEFTASDWMVNDYGDRIWDPEPSSYKGYVWRREGLKVVVLSDETDKPMLKFTESRLTKLYAPARQCCIHCQKPQGLMDEIKSKETGETHPYVCRTEYGGYYGYTQTLLPCEYPDGTKGPDPAPKAADISPTLGQETWEVF